MADYGWRNDRRRWESRDRTGSDLYGQNGNGWRDDDFYGRDRFGGRVDRDDWRGRGDDRSGRGDDYGRDGDYSAGYATPRPYGDQNLNHRPGGMRDMNSRGQEWNSRGQSGRNANRNGYPGNSFGTGSGPDYQDYGDWQSQGSSGWNPGGEGIGYAGNPYQSPYRDYDQNGWGAGNRGADDREYNRSFWNRARDEVASWGGDEDAERRRRQDRQASHSGRGPKGYVRSDDRIREDINERLTDDWQLDATNIDVVVHDGEVTLSGTVSDRDDKHRAEHLVENLSGIKHVQNNLRVDNSAANRGLSNPSLSNPVGGSANAGSGSALGTQQRQPATSGNNGVSTPAGTSTGSNAGPTH